MGMLSRAQKGTNTHRTIEIDEGLYEALVAIANMRETTPELIVEMHLTGFVRSYERAAVYKLSDHMPYGKYQGYTVREIVQGDPRYICWLIANSHTFRVDPEVTGLIDQLNTEETPQ